MSKPRKPPTPGEIKGILKGARKMLKGRGASNDLRRLLKNKKAVDILANAIVQDELGVTPKQLGIVYRVLATPNHRANLSSPAMFELGLKSRNKVVREQSEGVMKALEAEASGDSGLAERILARVLEDVVRGALPMDVRRWTLAELASEVSAEEADVDAAIDLIVATHDATRLVLARRHLDGCCSFSAPRVFESLRYPSPFEIERLVAAEDFKSLNKLLASAGAKRKSAEKSAPKLTWRDGTKMTLAAQAWILAHTHTTVGVSQRTEADAQKAVLRSLDLLRDTLSDESARDFARWVAEFEGKGAPRCVVPGPPAFEEVARLVLAGTKVSAYVLDDLTGYPLGRRALLRAEVAWPKSTHPKSARFFGLCHDAWPPLEELGDEADVWHDLAERFLADVAAVAHAFPWAQFRAHYLDHSLMGPKVRACTLLSGGAPLALDDAGEPVGKTPGSVTISTETPSPPPAAESFAERAQRTLDEELAARSRIPEFSRLAPLAPSRFSRALAALGFERAHETGPTKSKTRMVLRRVEIRVAPTDESVKLLRVTLVGATTTYAEASDTGLRFVGGWASASADQHGLIASALEALGLEDPKPPSLPSDWTLGTEPSQGPPRNARCLACGEPLEDFEYAWARYESAAPTNPNRQVISVGSLHTSCAEKQRGRSRG